MTAEAAAAAAFLWTGARGHSHLMKFSLEIWTTVTVPPQPTEVCELGTARHNIRASSAPHRAAARAQRAKREQQHTRPLGQRQASIFVEIECNDRMMR